MKKFVLLVLLVTGILFSVEAQNRSIRFETAKEWKKIVKKARKEKKLIFVDCYTSWCGPCKMLSQNVFTQDSVADFFNQTFVNAKFDMEKDPDGVMLKTQFGVKAFPTLVFVDPATQEVVHRMVGAGKADWLIAGARLATDPQNNLNAMMKRYAAGERGEEFLTMYLTALSSAYMGQEVEKVAAEYLNVLSADQLATKENWELIRLYVHDPLAEPLKKVMAEREKFYKIVGKEVVDKKLNEAINGVTRRLTGWRPDWKEAFDENKNTELIQYLQDIDFEATSAALAGLYTAAYIRKGDFQGLLDKMKEVRSYNLFRGTARTLYLTDNLEALMACKDKELVEKGIHWLDQECRQVADYFMKAGLMNLKTRLQTAIGDTAGADKSKIEEKEYLTEGEKRSGGKVIRAVRMN